jgi:alanyl-tRNA synthetase
MDEQRSRARAASKFGVDLRADAEAEAAVGELLAKVDRAHFSGYEHDEDTGRVVQLLRGKESVRSLVAGDEGQVILDATPFYAESGGQVGDAGRLAGEAGEFEVSDTQKLGKAHSHIGRVVRGEIKVGDDLRALVDANRRDATRPQPLRDAPAARGVAQGAWAPRHAEGLTGRAGPVAFRFFAHGPADAAGLAEIEQLVNDEFARTAVRTRVSCRTRRSRRRCDGAVRSEKYDDVVRVLSFGDFSTELCGGTHVARTGDIGCSRFVSEGGVAAGVRRIEALTGRDAYR